MEILKYWQVLVTVFSVIVGIYVTIKQTASNTIEIKEHEKRILETDKKLTDAIYDRNIKFTQIESQLSYLKASNDRIVQDYQEIKNDIRNINKTMQIMNDLLIKISTTCIIKGGSC